MKTRSEYDELIDNMAREAIVGLTSIEALDRYMLQHGIFHATQAAIQFAGAQESMEHAFDTPCALCNRLLKEYRDA